MDNKRYKEAIRGAARNEQQQNAQLADMQHRLDQALNENAEKGAAVARLTRELALLREQQHHEPVEMWEEDGAVLGDEQVEINL